MIGIVKERDSVCFFTIKDAELINMINELISPNTIEKTTFRQGERTKFNRFVDPKVRDPKGRGFLD